MFNFIVILVLTISSIIGLARGGTREVVGVVSFILAVLAAILALKQVAPLILPTVHTVWIAKALALLIVFVVVYVVLRIVGGTIAKAVPETDVGFLDHAIGLGFGLIRGLILLGVFNLVFRAVTPPEDDSAAWVTGAGLYPLTQLSGDALQALVPKGQAMVDKVSPTLTGAIDAPAAKIPDKTSK